MGYSIKDIENSVNATQKNLDKRSKERGEKLANSVARKTSQGRGLWVLILWPAWLLIFGFTGIFITALFIAKLGLTEPLSWIGMVVGFLYACAWYQSTFTIKHPFWSTILGYFGTTFIVLFLDKSLNINFF